MLANWKTPVPKFFNYRSGVFALQINGNRKTPQKNGKHPVEVILKNIVTRRLCVLAKTSHDLTESLRYGQDVFRGAPATGDTKKHKFQLGAPTDTAFQNHRTVIRT